MSLKNARTIGIRLDEKTTKRVEHFESTTHIEAVSLARSALFAALDEFEAHGSLSLPLRIVSSQPPPLARPTVYTPGTEGLTDRHTTTHGLNEPHAADSLQTTKQRVQDAAIKLKPKS